MTDLIKILQEADSLSLAVEQSRQNFEMAKAALEKAKLQLEDAQTQLNTLLSRSEELGLPKSRLKKLIEERTQALLASGLWNENEAVTPKAPRAPRKKAEKPVADFEETEVLEEVVM